MRIILRLAIELEMEETAAAIMLAVPADLLSAYLEAHAGDAFRMESGEAGSTVTDAEVIELSIAPVTR